MACMQAGTLAPIYIRKKLSLVDACMQIREMHGARVALTGMVTRFSQARAHARDVNPMHAPRMLYDDRHKI